MIEAIGLVKKYGEHLAVDHLNFKVEKGQILGFLGPNGAGKSTTMNMLTGYISATEGSVFVNGYDMLEEPEEAKKSIGYLPEQPPVYPDMTVTEYLQFVIELKQVPKKERKAELVRVLAKARLELVKGRLIKHLSKGYRQRVGIAQALVGNPEVIILDEPTVGLDPSQIIEIRDLMKELAKEHTVLLSSHIMQEISAVCDHIMIICHGKLVLYGTLEELQKQVDAYDNYELVVCGNDAALTAVLDKFSEQIEYEPVACDTPECTAASLKFETDVRKELFYALAQAKLPMMKLEHHVKTLEDIFLEATAAADAAYLAEQNGVAPKEAEVETVPEANEIVEQEKEEKEADGDDSNL